MGYRKTDNLYKNKTILLFKQVYATEKIDGTSAHIAWNPINDPASPLSFFSGGEKYDNFVKLFDQEKLKELLSEKFGLRPTVVYGEAYGGKCQGMSHRYGPNLKFCVFEVCVDGKWLNVPDAESVALSLGLEFVHYKLINTTLEEIDAERDAPSEQARRNGIVGDQPREGVVLRPIIEVTTNDGTRIIAKHKRDEERETATPRKVDAKDPMVFIKAQEIADEFCVPTRLDHVLQKIELDGKFVGLEKTGEIIKLMQDDIAAECKGEYVDTKEARRAISAKTVELFKEKLRSRITNE